MFKSCPLYGDLSRSKRQYRERIASENRTGLMPLFEKEYLEFDTDMITLKLIVSNALLQGRGASAYSPVLSKVPFMSSH